MKKIIIIMCIMMLTSGAAFAEKLPYFRGPIFDSDNYPVLTKYLTSYTIRLYNALDPNYFLSYNWGGGLVYTINSDGSITKMVTYDNMRKYDWYIQKVLLETPPPPFPKEMEYDSIRMSVDFWKKPYDDISVYYFPKRPVLNSNPVAYHPALATIDICKNYKKRNKKLTPSEIRVGL